MAGLRKDVLKSMHAEAQRSGPSSSTSSPAGNTAANGGSKFCQPLTSSPVRNSGEPFVMGTARTASSKTAAPNSFQPTTSSPLRNSGVSFTIASQSTASSQTTSPISAHQTPQVPPHNPVQLFTLSTASTVPTPTAPQSQTQSSSSTVQGAVPTPQAPPKASWQAFSFTNFRDTSAGPASTSGTRNIQAQTPQQQQMPLQQQQPQQASQQPPAASVSDEMDDVTPCPTQLRPQQAPQQAQQPAPAFVQQAVVNDNMDIDEAPKSPSIRPPTHPLRKPTSPARLRNAIPRIQQARRIARGAITKAKHTPPAVKKSANPLSKSNDEALAKKLWKSFTRLADLDTHKGLKRAAKILLRMLALARRASVTLWDAGVVEVFLRALPTKGADGVREFAARIVKLMPVAKERRDGIRGFNRTAPLLACALQQVDKGMSMGWVLNGINNALRPVYVAAARLRFRIKAGEEELFGWDAGTIRVFEEVVGFLGSLGQQANTSVRDLLGEVKYAAKQIFALLFTGIGEVMRTPW